MKHKKAISRSDFSFEFAGYGHYRVTYTSPVTGKRWSATTNDMRLIDKIKFEEDPKKTDLVNLKKVCKNN